MYNYRIFYLFVLKERVYDIYIYREFMYGENRHCKVIEDGSGANRIYALKSRVYNLIIN